MSTRRSDGERRIHVRTCRLVLLLTLTVPFGVRETSAQEPESASGGVSLADSDRLRFNVRFMAGYGVDNSHYDIGFESQGRVGYAIVEMFGKINDRFSYRIEVNPVNETQPLPSCGEEDFFYPNTPQAFGPNVACDNDGRMRVDDYRFIALDALNQQGPIRQAYVAYTSGGGLIGGRWGRFILPIGFGWEDAGSFTGKDATHIQRINAEANFGFMVSLDRPGLTVNAAGFLGNGNRFRDYDYFYSLDGSLDTNSGITGLLSASIRAIPGVEIRLARKAGFTGSKVERLPNFYAAKRNDMASVVSVRYRPIRHVAVFGEYASYLWGLTKTSAELLGLSDTEPVSKRGYYIGGDFSLPITRTARIGTTVTREELDRDDALIKYLSLDDRYKVSMGETERSTVLRFYLDLNGLVTVGVYRTLLDNPFPWVSGIVPFEGPRRYDGQGNDKWGLAARFTLR